MFRTIFSFARRATPFLSLAIILLSTGRLCVAGAGDFAVIAFEGQQAPGRPAGVVFGDNFGIPVVNAQGRIAFRARLLNPSHDSIWVFDPDSGLQAVAVEDDPAPGGAAGETFGSFSERVIIDDLGNIAFGSGLPGIGAAYFATDDLTVRRVAQTGMELPNAAAGNSVTQLTSNFSSPFTQTWMFNAGRLAMRVQGVANGDPDGNTISGVWSERPFPADRQLQVIARTGVDTSFNTISRISTNRLAETILTANFDPGPGEISRSGVWSEAAGGALTLVVDAGSDASGDIDFNSFGLVGINTNGQGVFPAAFTTPNGIFTNGVFLQFFESSFPVIVNAQSAPGLAGFEFLNPRTDIVSGGGQVAINAPAVPSAGGNPGVRGLWAFRNSGLEAVAITGNPAPGIEGGLVFNIGGNDFFEPVINREADLAFLAQLLDDTGTGVGDGIWAECDGVMEKVVALGDEIMLPSGESIEVTTPGGLRLFGRTGNEDGRPSGFSDRGDVVFRAEEVAGEAAIVHVETRIRSAFASGFEPEEDNMPAFCPE